MHLRWFLFGETPVALQVDFAARGFVLILSARWFTHKQTSSLRYRTPSKGSSPGFSTPQDHQQRGKQNKAGVGDPFDDLVLATSAGIPPERF